MPRVRHSDIEAQHSAVASVAPTTGGALIHPPRLLDEVPNTLTVSTPL